MPSFKKGDLVTITNYGGHTDGSFIGRTGPISNIQPLSSGEVNYFIDVGVPGFFFRDLICYEDEFEHAKEENNE